MTFNLSVIIDDLTKLVSAICAALTLALVWWKALPRLEEIHTQTNSLAAKAEAGAHAAGFKEGLEQGAITLDEIRSRAAAELLAAAKLAAEEVIAQAKLIKES